MLGLSSDVSVRRARISDAPALAAIFRDTWRTTYRGIIPHKHLESVIRRRGTARWRSSIRSGEMVLVLSLHDKMIGYATCGSARSRSRYKGEIYEIYLLADYQGLGFGEYLFEACRARLDERNMDGLLIWALAENDAAINFYWQRGGRPLTSAYERLGGIRLEKIAFVWE